MKTESPLLTFAEAAALLRVSSRTILRLLKEGSLRGYRLGERGPWRFTREQVMASMTAPVPAKDIPTVFLAPTRTVRLSKSAMRAIAEGKATA